MSHSMSSSRNIQLIFDTYQKSRLNFAQAISELATRKTNAKCLFCAGVLDLLRPILSDPYPTARQCAVVAVARLAENEDYIARKVLDSGMLKTVLDNIDKYNVYYKRSALYLARAVVRHNEELAMDATRIGALNHIVPCLEEFDIPVKENAAWALGYIGRHSQELASQVVDAGTLPMLVLGLQEPEISLKTVIAGALMDLAEHRQEAVVESGAICHLVKALECQEPKLKRSALAALSAIASSSRELAELVVAGGAVPPALLHCGHTAANVRRNAVCLVRDIVKHSVELAQLIVNTGGCGPLVQLVPDAESGASVPASMALGFIAGQSDQLAMAVISSKAIPALMTVIDNSDSTEAELCAASWALGHIAKHSPQHSEAVAVANAFPRLMQIYTHPDTSPELRKRSCTALKQSLHCCLHRPALEPLLHSAPPQILKYVLAQYAKILPHDARARRLFVTTGALKRVQEIESQPGSSLREYINTINACFPEEIVRFYSPDYSDSLLEKVEAYQPELPEYIIDRIPSECKSELAMEN